MALTDNIVAYYAFESGALTTDSSGNGQTLTNKNSVAETASGIVGYGADNGSGSNTKGFYRTSGGLTFAQIASAWTFNFWAKNEDTTVDAIFFRQTATSGGQVRAFSYWIPQVSVPRIMCTCYDGTGHDAVYNVTLTQGAWYMYSAVYDGTDLRLYLNGTQVGTPLSFTWSSASGTLSFLSVGTYMDTSGDVPYASLRGTYDEMGIWSRALSSTEITDLYNGGAGLAYPFTTTSIKTINGLAIASVKTVNGLSTASVKTVNGLA